MSRPLRDARYPVVLSDDQARRPKSQMRCSMGLASTDILADSRFQFDPDAWVVLLEEQKLLIANAAGVDPSKVRIHVGH